MIILFLVLAFLYKGGGEPHPEIFYWIYENIPGFIAFRDPIKIAYLATLPWSILFGYGLTASFQLLNKTSTPSSKKEYSFLPIIGGILLLFANLSFLLNDYPAADADETISQYSTFQTKELTIENKYLENFLEKDDGIYNTLFLPTDPSYGVLNSKQTGIYTPDISPSNNRFSTYLFAWRWGIHGPFFRGKISKIGSYLNNWNVKYIVYLANNDEYFETLADLKEKQRTEELHRQLENQLDLTAIRLSPSLTIYKNNNYKENCLFYIADTSYLINGDYRSILSLCESNNCTPDSVSFFPDKVKKYDNLALIENIYSSPRYSKYNVIFQFIDPAYSVDLANYEFEAAKAKFGLVPVSKSEPNLENHFGNIFYNKKNPIKVNSGILTIAHEIDTTDDYELWIRGSIISPTNIFREPVISNKDQLELSINNKKTIIDLKSIGLNQLNWVKIADFYSKKHENLFKFDFKGKNKSYMIDQIILISTRERIDLENKIDKMSHTTRAFNPQVSEIDYEKISSDRYILNFKQNKAHYIVFKANYNKYWHLKVNDKLIEAVETAYGTMAFFVDDIGSINAELIFVPQQTMNFGTYISLSSFFVFLIIVTCNKLYEKNKK